MLALNAAQEAAAIASGHSSPLTAGPIGTGTVDGFAAGMLLSGVVFLLILAQRRALRRPAGASAAVAAVAAQADGLGADGTNGPAEMRAWEQAASQAGLRASSLPDALDEAQATEQPGPDSIPFHAAPVETEMPAPLPDAALSAAFGLPEPTGPVPGPELSTHPYADVSPFGVGDPDASFMPFADASNEVVLQAGVRLEEWLEGQMRRPSLRGSSRASAHPPAPEPAPAPATSALVTAVPAAVAAAEAATAVVPVTPALATPLGVISEPAVGEEPGPHRRGSAYQSKHRQAGRGENKPWPDNHRRAARHAAASPARSGPKGRMFGLRQLRPVSAGD